jgi:uncharacterized protein
MKLREHASEIYHKLMQLRDAPHAIAGGVAIGLAMGFTPLVGMRIILAVLIALLSRCSKAAATIAVNFHEIMWIFPPTWFFIFRYQYKIGYVILHQEWPPHISKQELLSIRDWLNWRTLEVLWPMTVGSIFMVVPVGILTYYITLSLLKKYAHNKNSAPPPS